MNNRHLIFIAILLVGLALRVVDLGERSLWLDEYTSLDISSKSIHGIVTGDGFDSHTPPLYYVVLHLWHSFVPRSEVGLRSFSLIFDLLNLWLIVVIFRRSFDDRVALTAAALYAVSEYAVYYAQEGRMYSFTAFLVLVTFWAAQRVVAGRAGSGTWAGLIVAGIAGMYTHYYYAISLFGITLGLTLRLAPSWRRLGGWYGAMVAIGVAFLPWVTVILQLLGSEGQTFRRYLLSVLPYTLFRFTGGYANLPITYGAKDDYVATVIENLPLVAVYLGVFGALLVAGTVLVARRQPAGAKLILPALYVPPVAATLLSFASPMLSERYLIVIHPFYIGLLAFMLVQLWGGRIWGRLVSATAVVLLLVSLTHHYTNPAFGNTDWRRAGALIAGSDATGPVIVNPHYIVPLLRHYSPESTDFYGARGGARPWKPRIKAMNSAEKRAGFWLVERGTAKTEAATVRSWGFEADVEELLPRENGIRIFHFRKK